MMRRWAVRLGFAGAITACASGGAERILSARHDLFAGEWRSVTPTLEFLRLSVHSKSSERDELAARLTFSGVAWEGSGSIAGDSLVLRMTLAGRATEVGTVVARVGQGAALRTVVQSQTAPALVVDFVREP